METLYKISGNKNHVMYTEEFKRMVCEEYVSSRLGKDELARKHDIKGHGSILRWLRALGYETTGHEQPKRIEIQESIMTEDLKEKDLGIDELKKQIKQLKRELEDSQIKAEVYSTIIDIAEKKFGIEIRKKPDSKRSKK